MEDRRDRLALVGALVFDRLDPSAHDVEQFRRVVDVERSPLILTNSSFTASNSGSPASPGGVNGLIHARYSFDSSPDATRRALEVIAQTGRSSLTNALKHGDLTRPVQVTETWSRAAVRLTVHNTVDGAPPPPVTADHNGDTGTGMGLVNIAERVALVRGTVTVGEAPGGWELDARLPLDRHHADSDSATDTGEDDA
ncbi:hypothetical protein HQO44_16860 [Rhodococcus fascians]|nr:hypothetical protein [Rhodococcus fascians]